MVNWYDLMEQVVSRRRRQTSLGNVGIIIAKGILGDPGSVSLGCRAESRQEHLHQRLRKESPDFPFAAVSKDAQKAALRVAKRLRSGEYNLG